MFCKYKHLFHHFLEVHLYSMNERIKNLYIANKDNKTICFDTNIKGFHASFEKKCPKSRNYQWFYREFVKNDSFDWEDYHFQKLV